MNSITLIVSPYHVGIRNDAVGAGPLRLLDDGLASSLEKNGIEIHQVTVEPSFEADGEIGRSFEIFRQTSKLVKDARDAQSFPIILSGNCSASVGVHAGLSGSSQFQGHDVGCVWFDAHDDFNIPDTVLSGYFDSMPIAMMAGQCWKALLQTIPGQRPMKLDRFVHVGLRDLNDLERSRVEEAGYPVVWGSTEKKVDFATDLAKIVSTRQCSPAMVHVDLDVLDASVGQVNKFKPAPGGLSAEDLTDCMRLLPQKLQPAALTIASYDPRYDANGRISEVGLRAIGVFVKSLIDNGLVNNRD